MKTRRAPERKPKNIQRVQLTTVRITAEQHVRLKAGVGWKSHFVRCFHVDVEEAPTDTHGHTTGNKQKSVLFSGTCATDPIVWHLAGVRREQ